MAVINTTKGVRVFVNGTDLSDYFLSGTVSDSSTLSSSIVTTSGTLSFNGGPNNVNLDFEKRLFPIASTIKIWVALDNGRFALHPRGTLYIIDSSINIDTRTLNLDVGCSLAFVQGRENIYTNQVAKLFSAIPDSIGRNFKVDDLTFSNLAAALDACNRVMFQDAYGNIQTTPSFGYDAANGAFSAPKLTCFDTHTSLSVTSLSETSSQEYVASITVTANIDVPSLIQEEKDVREEEDLPAPTPEEAEEEKFVPAKPPPLYSEFAERQSQISYLGWNRMRIPGGVVYFDDEETSQTAATPCALPPGSEEPVESAKAPGKVCRCDISVKNAIVKESTAAGGFTEYEGKGNQVSYEESWEFGMVAVFASSYYSSVASRYEQATNQAVGYANNALSKYNQHKQALENFETDDPKYLYHQCNMEKYYETAENFRNLANNLFNAGVISSQAGQERGMSTLTRIFNKYDKSGKLVTKTELKYKHILSGNLGARAASDFNFYFVTDSVNASTGASNTVYSMRRFSTSLPRGKVGNNFASYGLVLSSQTVTSYKVSENLNVTTERYDDYEDSTRSTVRVSYSSIDSNVATEEDRIVTEGAGGTVSVTQKNEAIAQTGDVEAEVESTVCTIENETVEQRITVFTGFTPPSYLTQGWFGEPNAVSKTLSLPTDLMPIAPDYDEFAKQCKLPSIASRRSQIIKLMRDYALTQVKKTIGDQTGFRVVEQLRPELFGYHPCYPIVVSLESLNTAYKCRSSAATWGFDSNNCVCSFDVFTLGKIAQPVFSSPSVTAVQFGTAQQQIVITRSIIKIPENAFYIKISTLPENGVLELSGVPVSVGDEVLVSDIDAGRLVLVLS